MPEPRTAGCRAISTVVASAIIFAFILVVIVPALLSYLYSATQATQTLKLQSIKAIQQIYPGLNVTHEATAGSENTYIIENDGASRASIKFYIVSDLNGYTYIVKAAPTYNTWLLVGSMSITTEPVTPGKVEQGPDMLYLDVPKGAIRVRIVNGYLLAVVTGEGVRVQPSTRFIQLIRKEYAVVAGSVQTNYINLTSFTGLEDLLSSGDVYLTDDLAANSSNETLLESGFINTRCYIGYSRWPYDGPPDYIDGGFKPYYEGDIEGIFLHNIAPDPGMLIIGGKQGDYSTPFIKVTTYMPAYFYYPATHDAAILALKTTDLALVCAVFPSNGEVTGGCYQFYGPVDLAGLLAVHMGYDIANDYNGFKFEPTTPKWPITLKYQKAVFSSNLGFIAYTTTSVLYCPSLDNVVTEAGNFTATAKECVYLYLASDTWHDTTEGYYLGDVSIYASGYKLTVDPKTGYSVFYLSNVEIQGKYGVMPKDYLSFYSDEYPLVIKLNDVYVDKQSLYVYDYVRGVNRTGTEAFGIYYYNGYKLGDVGSLVALGYVGLGGRIKVFKFVPGETSGLDPYFTIADTDGNGLAELIFTNEWFKPGVEANNGQWFWYSDVLACESSWFGTNCDGYFYNPILGDLGLYGYGCEEQTLTWVYLKFGSKYAVNGTEIASVSIQIRYSYHEALGGDIDEIDDPKKGIWGFFIVDSEGNITSDVTYIYQQLAPIEDTWPPNTNYLSEAVFLPVPNRPELYYIAWGVNEPYLFSYTRTSGYTEDLEQTIIVEWIGMWYLHR